MQFVEIAIVNADAKSPGSSFSRSRFSAPFRKRGSSPRPGHPSGNASPPRRGASRGGSYVRTLEGFLYLAFILDVYFRRVVGWAMEGHLSTELVVDALRMAAWRRKPAPGLVHHSDRGVQYTSLSFSERLREVDITPSMGRTGTALDNAAG